MKNQYPEYDKRVASYILIQPDIQFETDTSGDSLVFLFSPFERAIFYANEYAANTASCNPRLYIAAFKKISDLIWEFKKTKKEEQDERF